MLALPDFMTPKELSEILRVDPATVIRRAVSGALEGAINVGTPKRAIWRIPTSAISGLVPSIKPTRLPEKKLASQRGRELYDNA